MNSPVPQGTPQCIFCHTCGAKWGIQAIYCRHCGTKLLWSKTLAKEQVNNKKAEQITTIVEAKEQKEIGTEPTHTPLLSVLGENTETGQKVTLTQEDRLGGTYVIGKTGSGKTTFMVNLILQDIEQGMGVCFFDTHGDAITDILRRFPAQRDEKDVILLDLLDRDYPFGLNLFQCADPTNEEEVSRVTSTIMDVFAKLFTESGDLLKEAPNMARTLQHTVPVLLFHLQPRMTMAEIPLLLMDETARNKLLAPITNPLIRTFWTSYDRWRHERQEELVSSTISRVNNFLIDALILRIVGQSETTLPFRQIMDEGKILLVKLSRQHPLITSLVGSVIVGQIANAAYSREDTSEHERRQFNLYADEYQRFSTPTFAELLAEVRKYKIATCVAHQFRDQLDHANRGATLNARNLIVFQVSGIDAEELAGEFEINPEEAWEEEIEPEWHERVEEEIYDGEEEIKIPLKDVVNHLLLQGHENPVVEGFANDYLHKLKNACSATPDASITYYGSSLAGVNYGTTTENPYIFLFGQPFYQMLEDIKYLPKAHHYASGRSYMSDEDSIAFHKVHYRWNYENYGSYWYEPRIVKEDLFALNTFLYNAMQGKISDLETSLQTSKFLQGLGHWGISSYLGFDTYVYVTYGTINPKVRDAYFKIMEFTRGYYLKKNAISSEQEYTGEVAKRLRELKAWCEQEVGEWFKLLVTDPYKHDFNLQAHVYDAEKFRYESFISSLLATIKILQQAPLQTRGSGQYQPRTRKQITYLTHPRKTISHPQRSYPDIKAEIVSELVSPPVSYTAHAKLGTQEFVIQARPFREPDDPHILKARRERIVANTRQHYCKKRTDVDAEIKARQEALIQQIQLRRRSTEEEES